MQNKSFTIIIPSYNSEATIEATLNSIVAQEYDKKLIQVLVIDDGSTDNTKSIIDHKFKSILNIEYHNKKNGQWGSVINYVKNNKLAKNDIVSVLDSDDFYTKKCLKIINKKINNFDLFVGSFNMWDGTKKKLKVYPYYFIFKRILNDKRKMHSPICLPLIYFSKKEVFYQLEDITEGIPFQDPDYASQLIKNSKSLIFSGKTTGLYYYNRAGNSVSETWDQKRMLSDFKACEKAILNDAQEIVSFHLIQKKFRNEIDKGQIKFEIKRKFSFKYIPFCVRWIYWLMHNWNCKKYFVYK